MSIASKLLELRKSKGLSQEELAIDLNISQSTISNYESGASKPDIESLKKYASYFQVALSEFFEEDNYTFYNYDNKGGNNGFVINQLSEQLLKQFEKRIEDKEYVINLQKETMITLKDTIVSLQRIIKGIQ